MGMGTPTMPGQDAFGAIQEIVRMLEADPETDWSKIDLEALRQHLIDMNEVTLKADAAATPIEGGLSWTRFQSRSRISRFTLTNALPTYLRVPARPLEQTPACPARVQLRDKVIPLWVILCPSGTTAGWSTQSFFTHHASQAQRALPWRMRIRAQSDAGPFVNKLRTFANAVPLRTTARHST
ncbi:hypothetical protein ACN2CC_32530 [Mesorhizobium muleiense]|uniref:hypothetical protein n=1 Tax=Mesorhizobium muleiense TaxID=1004279 RepID=UPI003AFA0CA0